MFKIERNVEIGSRPKMEWPFAKMEVGDSFFVPQGTPESEQVRSSSSWYGIRHSKKFSVRKVEGGLRVWRVK